MRFVCASLLLVVSCGVPEDEVSSARRSHLNTPAIPPTIEELDLEIEQKRAEEELAAQPLSI